jgi:Thoeris protein ThsB, TIR-like domain
MAATRNPFEIAKSALSYRLFISHAWAYSERYTSLIRLLDEAPRFTYHNYSVPRHDPAIDPNTPVGQSKLTDALRNQIRPSNNFLLLAGMYVDYRFWIQKEIDIAKAFGKRIIGIRRRGQQRTPTSVDEVSDVVVNWNTASIVDAIRGR